MIPKVFFDGLPIGDYCAAMCFIRQGLAGECWNSCKSVRNCCSKECECASQNPDCPTVDNNCVCLEDQWWYDKDNPCSQEFIGIIVTDRSISPAYTREVKQTLKGGSIGRLQTLPVEIRLEFFIVTSSEQGTDFAIDALSQLGAYERCEEDCRLPSLDFSEVCAPCDTEEEEDRDALIEQIDIAIAECLDELDPKQYDILGTVCHQLQPPLDTEIRSVLVADVECGETDKIRECFPTDLECGCPCVVDPDAFEDALASYEGGDTEASFEYYQPIYRIGETEQSCDAGPTERFIENYDTFHGEGELQRLVDWAITSAGEDPACYEIAGYKCDKWAIEEVPCQPDEGDPAELIAGVCGCGVCDSQVSFRNVLPTGPIIERETSLKRCCGTKAEWTFTAEIPYKFIGRCPFRSYRLRNYDLYPNWCCPDPSQCGEDDCLDSTIPTGEEGRGVLGARPSFGGGCYCDPVFVNATAIPLAGYQTFPTFVNWEIEADDPVENISVCFYEDLGESPLDDPELYACERPVISTIGKLIPGEVYRGDSEVCRGFEGGLDATANFVFSPVKLKCDKGWLVVKSDACNGGANNRLDIRVQLSRGTL